jgi:hypothetical protein
MWFFETVLALLEGEEETEYEKRRWVRQEQSPAEMTVLSRTAAQPHRPQLNGRPSAMHISGWP